MKTVVYGSSIRGNGHYMSGRECQDSCSFTESDLSLDEIKVIAVSDGHGGAPYVRSAEGARLAQEIAKSELYTFMENHLHVFDAIDDLEQKTDEPDAGEDDSHHALPISEYGKELLDERRLNLEKKISDEIYDLTDYLNIDLEETKDRIIKKWCRAVDDALAANPLTMIDAKITNLDSLDPTHREETVIGYGECAEDEIRLINRDLKNGIVVELETNHRQLYGATLLAAAQYKNHTFILQLGDGDVTVIDERNNVFSPIKKREYHVANVTDSICQQNAPARFSSVYLHESLRMVMLSTDGIANALEHESGLAPLAFGIYESLEEDPESLRREFKPLLRRFSSGSMDDCTICFIANEIDDDAFFTIKVQSEEEEEVPSELQTAKRPMFDKYGINEELYLLGVPDENEPHLISDAKLTRIGMKAIQTCFMKDKYLELISANDEVSALPWKSRILNEILNLARGFVDDTERQLNAEQLKAYRVAILDLLRENPLRLIRYNEYTFSMTEGGVLSASVSEVRHGVVLSTDANVLRVARVTPELYRELSDSFAQLVAFTGYLPVNDEYKLRLNKFDIKLKKEI